MLAFAITVGYVGLMDDRFRRPTREAAGSGAARQEAEGCPSYAYAAGQKGLRRTGPLPGSFGESCANEAIATCKFSISDIRA